MVDAIAAIKQRRSIRYFDPDRQPSQADLEEVVKLAGLAPSWVDSQPWRVYLALGDTVKKIRAQHLALAEAGKAPEPDWETWHREDWDPYPRENMARHNQASDSYLNTPELQDLRRNVLQKNLYFAPAIAYLTLPKHSNLWSVYDLGAFAQTLALAAQAKGIDSIPAYELVKYPAGVREIMGIPDDQTLAMGIALGYAKDNEVNGYRAPRRELADFLTVKN
ncbi:nitrobenzoate reductase [Lactobacillus nasalidis]|uniref:Nitrobenzoate reductase n=1 Tax=Lactobacillus nasalidis TaxID=2797258 RepID=A0ABQ3W2T5_9LACO|nr:nitroreductase family protein [Lactobacillus nasalidis]GHV98121.1 nitrobenzoate reductase [Lactobacillus nasalidis]GHV99317.1 nitrobenzoate reductase [Lactobacillus nasalidis]GHW00635.1 nitrobenzoate reductase [Lactobacillus nasalidis]